MKNSNTLQQSESIANRKDAQHLFEESTDGRWHGSSVSSADGQEWNKSKEMDFTYTNLDRFIRYSLGENANFSNAFYNGDYTLSLEEAQVKKYRFVSEQLRITKESRVLDLGCGWGGWLNWLRNNVGCKAIGVNLSKGQVASCRKNGLEVYLKDARYITLQDFGMFDAITAFGSFEHVVSVDDYLQGKQDEIYHDYFRHVYNLLPKGGRFYIQSMVFSKNMIPYKDFNINASKNSSEYILALLTKHNPDSWLPYGHEQIVKCAEPFFEPVFYNSGRLDYIKTNKEWTKLYYKFGFKKYLWYLSLLPKYFTDKEFRYQLDLLRIRPNRVCFEREIMDHARLVFEKK